MSENNKIGFYSYFKVLNNGLDEDTLCRCRRSCVDLRGLTYLYVLSQLVVDTYMFVNYTTLLRLPMRTYV